MTIETLNILFLYRNTRACVLIQLQANTPIVIWVYLSLAVWIEKVTEHTLEPNCYTVVGNPQFDKRAQRHLLVNVCVGSQVCVALWFCIKLSFVMVG